MPRICCLGCALDSLLVHTHESQQPWEEDHDRRKRRQSYRSRHHRPHPRLLDDSRSWEKWVEHYEGKGYRMLTPTHPGFEGEVEALRLGQAGVGGGYRQLHPRTPGGLRGLQE